MIGIIGRFEKPGLLGCLGNNSHFIERWVGEMQERSAIKTNLFAPHQRTE